jgi:hypothetical protein
MEIFDYLNCRQIFSSFFNLNYRFNSLCTYYPNSHIDASDPSFSQRTFIHLLNSILSRQVRSIKFCAEKWISRIAMKYFSSLNSLTFIGVVNPRKIEEFLEKLPSLDQLHHLSINCTLDKCDRHDLTAIIFKLSNLKRLEFYAYGSRSDFFRLDQPLLSLRHFSTGSCERNDSLKLISFMPNLISLELSPSPSPRYYDHSSHFPIIEPKILSKLKSLRMSNVRGYGEIYYIFRLCPQVEIFKVQCQSLYDIQSMIKAKDWEQLLIPMKFVRKIEINVRGLRDSDVIDLSEYDTEFWTQRNCKAIEYNDQEPIQRYFTSNNTNALLIK